MPARKPTVERHFAAAHGGRLYDHDDPAQIGPWAATADEPVFVRVKLAGTALPPVHAVKATAVRIPHDQDATEFLAKISGVMEEQLRERAAAS